MPRALPLLFALVGAVVLLGALAEAAATWRSGQTAARAPGVVVRLNAGGSHPEVRFVPAAGRAAGRAVEYPQNGLVGGYDVGDRVTVLYDPARPDRAVVDTIGARYGFTALFAVLGAAFLGVAAVQWPRPPRPRRGPGGPGR